jgi:hypothetical protein
MRVLAFDNTTGNGYAIKYWAEPSMFDDFLPTAQEMIDSFVINYKPPLTQLSTDLNTQPQIESSPSSLSNFSTENSAEDVRLASLPQSLTVIADSEDTDFPLNLVIGPNSTFPLDTDADVTRSTFELDEYTPKFTFQFLEGSNADLQIVKSILIGQIKSYNSIEDALNNAQLWRNIPLNDRTALRLDHQGLNFMIVEVDFANSLFGLYTGVFDLQTTLDKDFYNDQLRDELREDKSLQVASTSKHSTKKELYWDAVTPLICNNLQGFGFNVCE